MKRCLMVRNIIRLKRLLKAVVEFPTWVLVPPMPLTGCGLG